MLPFASQVIETLRAHKDELIAETQRIVAQQSTEQTRAQAFSESSYQQVVGGFIALIEESVEERPDEIRSMYMETVLPSLVKSGSRPERLTATTAALAVYISHLLTREVAPEHHRGLATWLERFFGQYVADECRVAYEAANLLATSGSVR